MRVVLDANVYVSALISASGSPAQILSHWYDDAFELLISKDILLEIGRVMRYPKLHERYHLEEELVNRFLALLAHQARMIEPKVKLYLVEGDPADNRYLECSIAGGADYVVSGDGHLLDLREYLGAPILSPREFLIVLGLEACI